MRRKISLVVSILLGILLFGIAVSAANGQNNNYPWNVLVFDGQSRAWDASRMKLVPEPDGTITAYVLVRDIYIVAAGQTVRASWKGHIQEEIAFNGLVQTRGLSTPEFIQSVFSYDSIGKQLAGIFWSSDQTGWELSRLRDHDATYRQEIYSRTVRTDSDGTWEEVIFVLHGIPISGTVHGQLIFLYPGNPDGTVDHVWLNPGWMDTRDHDQYWVIDCQDRDAFGEIINGVFDRSNFQPIKIPCT
ncbi:MAG: hypothetical protein WC242_02940 [Candidatus Paceibacterota bacterium]|jgi:hypothetical protein